MKNNIQELKAYEPDKSKAMIRLDANENAFDFSGEFMEEIFIGVDAVRFNRYPETDSIDLRNAYSNYCGAKIEQIIAGNGSDEIIRIIMESFIGETDTIVYHDPTFAMYEITCKIIGGKGIKVPSLDNFKVDIDGIIETANKNKSKVIILCNPNNPTGGAIAKEEIVRVIEETDSIVVVDEAYFEFFGQSVVDLIEKYDRLIVLRTLSKAFGLAAARIGFGIADKKIMDVLYKVKPPYNLNSVSQMLGMVYLKHSDHVIRTVEKTIELRTKLINDLFKFDFLTLFPTESNFVFLKTDKMEEIKTVLKDKIAVRFFNDEYFRISVGTRFENDELIRLLEQID